jgi:hypothetical protein
MRVKCYSLALENTMKASTKIITALTGLFLFVSMLACAAPQSTIPKEELHVYSPQTSTGIICESTCMERGDQCERRAYSNACYTYDHQKIYGCTSRGHYIAAHNECVRQYNRCASVCEESDRRELGLPSKAEERAAHNAKQKSTRDAASCRRVQELGGSLTPECEEILAQETRR